MTDVEEQPIMYEGPPPERRRRLWLYVLIVLVVAAIAWHLIPRRTEPKPPPIAVVSDRPGGDVKQAEAVRALRRHLVSSLAIRNECIAIRREAAYRFIAVDSCKGTRLGTFEVDPKTNKVK